MISGYSIEHWCPMIGFAPMCNTYAMSKLKRHSLILIFCTKFFVCRPAFTYIFCGCTRFDELDSIIEPVIRFLIYSFLLICRITTAECSVVTCLISIEIIYYIKEYMSPGRIILSEKSCG